MSLIIPLCANCGRDCILGLCRHCGNGYDILAKIQKEKLEMSEIKVGQKVWVKFPHRQETEIEQLEVAAVGRKYFSVYRYGNQAIQFHLDSLRQKTETNYQAQVYLSLENYEQENRATFLKTKINRFFRNFGWRLNLAEMERIAAIIGIEAEKENE